MDAATEVKERVRVEDLVGSYIELKKAGRNFKAVCPFHSEKTPSLVVSPDKGIWHCFGCHKGGDVFEFVMQKEGVGFREALEILADRAGVDLTAYGHNKEETEKKKRSYQLLELSTKYYEVGLKQNPRALAYAKDERQLNEASIKKFRVGYSPDIARGLSDQLLKRGFNKAELISAGIANESNGRMYDMFRGRLMLPLMDRTGRVIGFTGRHTKLNQGGPKYLNTPATILFNKSRHIFGLSQAKDAIREENLAILVEGNLDVLTAHQVGLENVVAASGTAVTADHIKQLSYMAEAVYLAFDGDAAGLKAAERTIIIGIEVGANIFVIQLPKGSDPDDILRSKPELFEEMVKKAVYGVDWLLMRLAREYNIATPTGKKQYSSEAAKILSKLRDQVEQEHYVREVANRLNTSIESIRSKLNGSEAKPSVKNVDTETSKTEVINSKNLQLEESLLGLSLAFTQARISLSEVEAANFSSEINRKIFNSLIKNKKRNFQKLPEDLKDVDTYVKILMFKSEEMYADWSNDDIVFEALNVAHLLKKRLKQQTREEVSEALRAAEAAGDEKLAQSLLKQYQSLTGK